MYLLSPNTKLYFLAFYIVLILLLFNFKNHFQKVEASFVPELSDDDWDIVLYDEWMILFCVSWHPACKHFSSTWHRFSLLQNDYIIKMAFVNFTNNPDLSARFLISEVPTLVHSKYGTFRKLNKLPSDYFEIGRFLQKESWKNIDPIPPYLAPNTFQMTIISDFVNNMMHNSFIKDIHQTLVKRYFLPFWFYYPLLIFFYQIKWILYGSFIFLFLFLTRIHPKEAFFICNEPSKQFKSPIMGSGLNLFETTNYKSNEKFRFLNNYKNKKLRKN